MSQFQEVQRVRVADIKGFIEKYIVNIDYVLKGEQIIRGSIVGLGEVSRLRTQSTVTRELPVQDTFYNVFRNSRIDMWILIDFKTKIPAFIVY